MVHSRSLSIRILISRFCLMMYNCRTRNMEFYSQEKCLTSIYYVDPQKASNNMVQIWQQKHKGKDSM